MIPDGTQARLDELQKELIRKANSKQDCDTIADEQPHRVMERTHPVFCQVEVVRLSVLFWSK